jgi:hypothetical protein
MRFQGDQTNSRLTLAAVVILAGALCGCWIPENFDTRVSMNKDGSYVFDYDGLLGYVPAIQAASMGAPDARLDGELKKAADELRREPGFRKVDYVGKGRFRVSFEKAGKPGEAFHFLSKDLDFFSVLPQPDHTIRVEGTRPKADVMQQLQQIGAHPDGTLSVSVPYSTKVLNHNANSEPMFFGLIGSYKWNIKSPAAGPAMVVQLPN